MAKILASGHRARVAGAGASSATKIRFFDAGFRKSLTERHRRAVLS